MFEGLPLDPGRGEDEGVAAGMAEDEEALGGEQRGEVRVIQELLGAGLGASVEVLLAVGRVGEDEVEGGGSGGELGEGGEHVLDAEGEVVTGELGGGEVGLDAAGVFGGQFDGEGVGCAAAEAFQAKRGGAGEQFEDRGSADAFAEAVEDGLPDEVRGGAYGQAFGCTQDSSAGGAADDAHGGRIAWKPRSPRGILRARRASDWKTGHPGVPLCSVSPDPPRLAPIVLEPWVKRGSRRDLSTLRIGFRGFQVTVWMSGGGWSAWAVGAAAEGAEGADGQEEGALRCFRV